MLEQELKLSFASMLGGKSATTPSRWAERYRVMGGQFPGNYSFKYHPWTRDIHDAKDQEIVLRKGAQTGLTEYCINTALFYLDKMRLNVAYFLPTTSPDAENFSRTRIDQAIALSPYIRSMFTGANQSGIKSTAYNTLYIRGAKVSRQLKTIDTALTICDEADEFPHFAIPMIRKRMAGQLSETKKLIGCSTPSVNGSGIDTWFQESTQEYFYFKCPSCGRYIRFIFPDSLVITADSVTDPKIKNSHYICHECKAILPQEGKPDYLQNYEWVKTQDSLIRGFQIDELYSYTMQPWEVAQEYLRGLLDPYHEQEFYNSTLGVPHVVDRASVSDADIEACLKPAYRMSDIKQVDAITTMGIDVGKELHYVVKKWDVTPDGLSSDINDHARGRFAAIGTVKEFHELDPIIRRFNPMMTVIDANPETRQSRQFCVRHEGRAFMCYYGRDAAERQVNVKPTGLAVSVHRTSWLDQTLGRYHNRTNVIPMDVPTDFKIHIKNLVRSYKLDNEKSREKAEYKKVGPDHYAHADNYAEIALNLVMQIGFAENM